MKKIVFSILLIVVIIGCSYTPRPSAEYVYKLSLYNSGKIVLDEDTVSTLELEKTLIKRKTVSCELWYYKELTGGGPPKDTIKHVLDILGRTKIPVSFSSKPDFSDEVDIFNGKSKPRKNLQN